MINFNTHPPKIPSLGPFHFHNATGVGTYLKYILIIIYFFEEEVKRRQQLVQSKTS